jgi:hypothetical protein
MQAENPKVGMLIERELWYFELFVLLTNGQNSDFVGHM